MNREEIKVAVVTLGLIGLAALTLGMRKNTLGKPGLLLESQVVTNEHGVKVADQRVALPSGVAGYADELMPITAREIEVLPKDTVFGRRFYRAVDDPNFFCQVSAIMMGTDRTSLHKPYYCITGQGWRIDSYEVDRIPMASPKPYELQAQVLPTTGEHRTAAGATPVRGLFVYWYVSDTQLAATHKEQMWLLGRDLISHGTLKRWSYISMFSICAPGEEKLLLEKMKRLAGAIVPRFQIPPGGAEVQTALLDKGGDLH